jgi:hypothetical protein
MRIPFLLAATMTLVATSAQARLLDPKALARFDLGYARCEARYPYMQGFRDETYLSMWRIKANPKSMADLAKLRSGAAYRSEKQRAAQTAKGAVPAASSPVERECQALWAERQRLIAK